MANAGTVPATKAAEPETASVALASVAVNGRHKQQHHAHFVIIVQGSMSVARMSCYKVMKIVLERMKN